MRAFRPLILAVMIMGTALPFSTAQAGGVPTFDSASIAQSIAQLQQLKQIYGIGTDQLDTALKELQRAIETVDALQTQITQLETQIDAITGAKGISDLLNGTAFQDARDIANTLGEINATLAGSDAGLPAGDIVGVRVAAMRDEFAIPDASEIYDPTRAPVTVAAHNFASQSTISAIALSQDGFERANGAIGRVEGLVAEIDGTPDLKASVDLNTRLMAEVAFMLADKARMDAAAHQMQGALANQTLREDEAGARRLRFRDRAAVD